MVDRADLATMSQDERLRALERDLVRSGRTLYEWASAILDERKPVAAFTVQANGSLVSDMMPIEGLRFQFFNVSDRDVRVEVSVAPAGLPQRPIVRDQLGVRDGNGPAIGSANERRRGVCSVCTREVAMSTQRILAARHVGSTPGSNGLNGQCSGSGRRVRGVFCTLHGAWPCDNPPCLREARARAWPSPIYGRRARERFDECEGESHATCRGDRGGRNDREFCECECHEGRGPCQDGCRGDPRNVDCRHSDDEEDA